MRVVAVQMVEAETVGGGKAVEQAVAEAGAKEEGAPVVARAGVEMEAEAKTVEAATVEAKKAVTQAGPEAGAKEEGTPVVARAGVEMEAEAKTVEVVEAVAREEGARAEAKE